MRTTLALAVASFFFSVSPRVFAQVTTPAHHLLMKRKLIEASLTVLRNERHVLPLRGLDTLRIASVSIGPGIPTVFQSVLARYSRVSHFAIRHNAGRVEVDSVKALLAPYNLIIGSFHETPAPLPGGVDLSSDVVDMVAELSVQHIFILSLFDRPEVLSRISGAQTAAGLIVAYHDDADTQDLAAQLIFGATSATGRLEIEGGDIFHEGDGLDVEGGIRLGYTLPEEVGIDSETLIVGIDSLVAQALAAKAIPGCQVLVARDRKVVFHKSYGVHSYSDTVAVKPDDLYDLASVTKISTAMAALMKLYDEGKFRLDATLGEYLPKFQRSNKSGIPMSDLLTHQGRLIPFISFYQHTYRENGSYKWATIRRDSSKRFPVRLSDKLFIHRKYSDKMVNGIRKSPLLPEKKYVYSDFFFMLAPRVVESMIDGKFEDYLDEHFYSRLGATTVTFNPLEKYPAAQIVPTESDYLYRRQPVHGLVHDENASMMGGVSGHAGLFSNANDLAKLMQMYLDMGAYGGERYIADATLRKFSNTQFPENNNRRALGFDKPNLEYVGVNNNTAKGAGPLSFGHTGFTGTFAWVDPDTRLLYIFLSNRVHPTRANTRLYRLNTRTQIQQVVYDAIDAGEIKPKTGD